MTFIYKTHGNIAVYRYNVLQMGDYKIAVIGAYLTEKATFKYKGKRYNLIKEVKTGDTVKIYTKVEV